jgi:hypothetical protein
MEPTKIKYSKYLMISLVINLFLLVMSIIFSFIVRLFYSLDGGGAAISGILLLLLPSAHLILILLFFKRKINIPKKIKISIILIIILSLWLFVLFLFVSIGRSEQIENSVQKGNPIVTVNESFFFLFLEIPLIALYI